jgi:D,D-heptose 1,7-bisphosphate phosphatase
MLAPAVFLDKDGTIIDDLPYNVDPRRIVLLPGTEQGLQLLHKAGFKLFVITNQSGIARGYFTEQDLAGVERHLREVMEGFGVPLSGFYYCPHLPEGRIASYAVRCACRKPEPGLIFRAAREHSLDVRNSWFVGDILNDVEAGRMAGCRTVLINNGKETEWILSMKRLPHHIVGNLAEAAAVITAVTAGRQSNAGAGLVSASNDTKKRRTAVNEAPYG